MKNNREKVFIADIAVLYDSLHKTPEYSNDGYPMVRVTDISRGYLNLSNTKKVDEYVYKEFTKKHKPQVGDILFSRVGSYGNSSYVDNHEDFCLGQNTVCISPNHHLIDSFYLYCCLNSFSAKQQIDAFVGGASQPTISLKNINLLEIPYFKLPTQKKIAGILKAYDDLIENNTRRIEILEEMARSLYREWFVNFRFPGHEQVKMVDSELGLIPEGWEVQKLEKVADINASTIKPSKAPEEINYIDISSVSTGKIDKIEPITFSKASSRARRIVKQGDILWSTVRPNRKSYSLILNPIPNLIVSTGFAVITAKKAPYTYLYHALTTDNFVDYLTNNATGSAYPAVNTGDFKNANVLIPRIELMDKFHNIVADLFAKKDNFLRKNGNLRQTRDLLLPKLISGEIKIENLNINTEEIAA